MVLILQRYNDIFYRKNICYCLNSMLKFLNNYQSYICKTLSLFIFFCLKVNRNIESLCIKSIAYQIPLK